MKSSNRLLTLLLIAVTLAKAAELVKTVEIPWRHDAFKHVTHWENPREDAQISLTQTPNGMNIHWSGSSKQSRVTLTPYLVENTLAQIQTDRMVPHQLVMRIRYARNDLPLLKNYLFFKRKHTPVPFHVHLKNGSHEYAIRSENLTQLHELQCRGGEQELSFTIESVFFRCMDRYWIPIPLDRNDFNHIFTTHMPLDGATITLTKKNGTVKGHWEGHKDGHSKIIVSEPVFQPVLKELQARKLFPDEMILRMRYDRDDLPMLKTFMFFVNSNNWYFPPIRLKKGVHNYVIQNKNMKQEKLAQIRELQFRGGTREFTIEAMYFHVAPKKERRRRLTISSRRKTAEILPGGTELKDFYINSEPPQQPRAISPASMTIQLQDKHLSFRHRVACRSANRGVLSDKRDAPIWSGDCLELLISPLLDNRYFAQIDISSRGSIYDGEMSFDPVLVAFRNRTDVNFRVKSSVKHQDAWLEYQVDVPLEDVKINVRNCPVVALQIACQVTEDKKYYSWNKVTSNLLPIQYGLLYFNQTPFGKGQLEFTSIFLEERHGDLEVKLLARDFPPGNYVLQTWLTAPDHSINRYEQKIALKEGEVALILPNVKDLPGKYTLMLMVKNDRGQVRPFAVNLDNKKRIEFPFGQKKLFPFPKSITWKKGYFSLAAHPRIDLPKQPTKRTMLTAQLLKKRLLGQGVDCLLTTGQQQGIVLRLDASLGKAEGYKLNVTPKQIVVTGADEAGLFYGTITLHQLTKLEMRRQEEAPIPCVEIWDYPDLPHRICSFSIPDQVGQRFRDFPDMDSLLDFLERFVVGNKNNLLKIYGFETMIYIQEFPRLNFGAQNRKYTWQDMERFGKFCRDNFVDLMIALPAGGHDFWISNHNRKELNEYGWRDTGNVSSPLYRKIYFTIADKLIKATKCTYFSPMSDEWWSLRDPKIKDIPETINGKPRAEVFLDFHLAVHDFLKKRGIRMGICEDMLNPIHNGAKYDTYKVIDRLPRDILILIWLNMGDAAKYFGEKGFECWGCSTGWATYDGPSRKYIKGYGTTLYGFSKEWRYHLNHTCVFHNIWFMGANYAWNFNNTKLSWNYDDMLNDGIITAAECVAAEPYNPHGGEKTLPLDVSAQMNHRVPDIHSGQREVCHIPMTIANSFRGNCIRNTMDSTSVIPVNRKCSSLIFLHNAIAGPQYRAKPIYRHRLWPFGYPVADYLVKYQDGTTKTAPARLGTTIYYDDFQHQAGNASFCRGLDITYNQDLQPYFMYQYEWVNPFPDKLITEIAITTTAKYDFIHQLFAISTREVKQR